MSLEDQCPPCRRGQKPLTHEEVVLLLREIPEWEAHDDHHLTRSFWFDTYRDGLAFVVACAELAEVQNHHPELVLGYGCVSAKVWTHDIDGLARGDFVLAAKIDTIAAASPGLTRE